MKVTWIVTPVGYQRIAKPCPSCNVKRGFAPPGAFRVNSQRKVLDIWSIYKCVHYEYTWNILLFSRLHVSKINRELYHRSITNDTSTVHYFANNKAILNRNNAELAGKPDLRIQEQWQVSINSGQNVTVSIRPSHSFQVNVLSILRRQPLLSTTKIKKLIDEGRIRGVAMKELKSRKLMTRQLDFKLSVVISCARRKVVLSQR